MRHFFAVYHRIDTGSDDMFETCLASYRRHHEGRVCVVTDNLSQEYKEYITNAYDVDWWVVSSMKRRRALAKVEYLWQYMLFVPDGDEVLAGDIDLYFCNGEWPEFDDFAVTTRCYQYYKPINGGVIFLKASYNISEFMDWHVQWSEAHKGRHGVDWTVGQAFLCYVYEKKRLIEKERGVKITVLDSEWNYCPGVDVFGEKTAIDMVKNATPNILHLKSELKKCIYDGWLDGAITRHGKGEWNWQIHGA